MVSLSLNLDFAQGMRSSLRELSSAATYSFSLKKCINSCRNSLHRTENVVGYMPRQWQFKVSSYNLHHWGKNQRIFYCLKSSRSFSKYIWKKNWRMIPMLRNVVINQKCQFCENYTLRKNKFWASDENQSIISTNRLIYNQRKATNWLLNNRPTE